MDVRRARFQVAPTSGLGDRLADHAGRVASSLEARTDDVCGPWPGTAPR